MRVFLMYSCLIVMSLTVFSQPLRPSLRVEGDDSLSTLEQAINGNEKNELHTIESVLLALMRLEGPEELEKTSFATQVYFKWLGGFNNEIPQEKFQVDRVFASHPSHVSGKVSAKLNWEGKYGTLEYNDARRFQSNLEILGLDPNTFVLDGTHGIEVDPTSPQKYTFIHFKSAKDPDHTIMIGISPRNLFFQGDIFSPNELLESYPGNEESTQIALVKISFEGEVPISEIYVAVCFTLSS
ncbi:MAG: hypothetical protein AAF694_24840 [Bacteroidota bacterium]